MAIKKVFKSYIPSSKFVFASGKECNFVGGEYFTDDPKDIKELESEIKLGNPHIYIDPDKVEVDTDTLDPIEFIKRKAISDYIAAEAVATKATNDMGKTATQKLNPANSSTVKHGAAGSSAGVSVNINVPANTTK